MKEKGEEKGEGKGKGGRRASMYGNPLGEKCRVHGSATTWKQVVELFDSKPDATLKCTEEEWDKHLRSARTEVPFSCGVCGEVRRCAMRDAAEPQTPHPRSGSHTPATIPIPILRSSTGFRFTTRPRSSTMPVVAAPILENPGWNAMMSSSSVCR